MIRLTRLKSTPKRISIGEYLELRHWVAVLGITPPQLRQAVREIRSHH